MSEHQRRMCMLSRRFWHHIGWGRQSVKSNRRANPAVVDGARSVAEALESRTLLSESASAQLALLSTTGTPANPVFNYELTLTNTGTTNLGTFWLAWVPGADLLPMTPTAES